MVRKYQGLTIIEACLVMSLLSMILALVAIYFSRAKHYASDTETYSRVQGQANLALRRVTDAFYRGSKEWNQYYGDCVIFLSSEPVSDSEPKLEFDAITGKIVWKKWVCFYHDPVEKKIFRVEQPLDAPTSNLLTQPTPSVSPSFFRDDAGLVRRPVAREVSAFQISGSGFSYDASVTCESISPVPRKSEEDKKVEVTLSTEIFLIN